MRVRMAAVAVALVLVAAASGLQQGQQVVAAQSSSETGIILDGSPQDWIQYEAVLQDPEGDCGAQGFDIATVKAVADADYLYLLIETHGPRQGYEQLDIEVLAGDRRFLISIRPEERSPAWLSETTHAFTDLGPVEDSASIGGEAVEVRVARLGWGGGDLTLLDVRPMAGECCGEDWKPLDHIEPVQVPELAVAQVGEPVDPVPSFCTQSTSPGTPFGTLQSVPVQFLESGYLAEWFVAPGPFNMPQDVMLTPSEETLVLATRSFAVFLIAPDGEVLPLAEGVYGYTSDVDLQGNAYLYSQGDGRITRISGDGEVSIVVESSDLVTDCTSGFAVGPDGKLYVAKNLCSVGRMNRSDLYCVTRTGESARVASNLPALNALRTTHDGRFAAATTGPEIYEISLQDFSLRLLGVLPGREGISVGGLASDDQGNLYVSTGTWERSGRLFRLDSEGQVSLVADIPGNGLSGIEWKASTGEILGVQLQLGSLLSVSPDGQVTEVVSGNGLTTPRGIAFSPFGYLAVSNEDAGLVSLSAPDGWTTPFFAYNSYTTPVSFLSYDADGTLCATEGAPGLTERVVTVPPGEAYPIPLVDAARPCGIVRRADGCLVIAETIAGRVSLIDDEGRKSTLVDGLVRPSAMTTDTEGNVYVVVGTAGRPVDPVHMPNEGDAVLRIDQDGNVDVFCRWEKIAGLAFAPSGELFATTGRGGGILRISATGHVTAFADGFDELSDLAFDLTGNLYASETVQGGIIRFGPFACGDIIGSVTTQTGVPVAGACVQILCTTPVVVGQIVTSDAAGQFRITAAPRDYSITVWAAGHPPVTVNGISVVEDGETEVPVVLD